MFWSEKTMAPSTSCISFEGPVLAVLYVQYQQHCDTEQYTEEKTKFQPSPAFVQLWRGRCSGRRCWINSQGNKCPPLKQADLFLWVGAFMRFFEWPAKRCYVTQLLNWKMCSNPECDSSVQRSLNIVTWYDTLKQVKSMWFGHIPMLMLMIGNCHSEHQMRWISAADQWSADDIGGRWGLRGWGASGAKIQYTICLTFIKHLLNICQTKSWYG